MTDAEVLKAAVTAAFVRGGKDLTAPEIAAELGWTEGKVRRVLTNAGGCIPGLQSKRVPRPVRPVGVYGPTRETLRQALQFATVVAAVEEKAQALEAGRARARALGAETEANADNTADLDRPTLLNSQPEIARAYGYESWAAMPKTARRDALKAFAEGRREEKTS